MILDLKHVESFPFHTVLKDETVRKDIGIDSIREIKSLSFELSVQKSDDEYFCQGFLTANAVLECARCLTNFQRELTTKIDFIIAPEGQNKAKDEDAIDNEDYVFYDIELCADLWEHLRQALVLAVDMKPICIENCRGFCSICSVNRNEKACKCATDNSKSQFAELRNLP